MSPNPIPSGYDATNDLSVEESHHILELQLRKIRNEASAARLEAQAAEIELMMRGLLSGHPASVEPTEKPTDKDTGRHPSFGEIRFDPPEPFSASTPSGPAPGMRFANWGEVQQAQARNQVNHSPWSPASAPQRDTPAADSDLVAPASAGCGGIADEHQTRIDAGSVGSKRPHFLDLDSQDTDPPADQATANSIETDDVAASPIAALADQSVADQPDSGAPCLVVSDDPRSTTPAADSDVLRDADLDVDEEAPEQRRGKPAAWLVSAVVHVGVLILLAAIGLQTHRPKDQVALRASFTSENEMAMQTFEIESIEPETQPEVTQTPSQTEYELSPVGEIAAAEFTPDSAPSPLSATAASMASEASSAAKAVSIESDSTAKIQFCGVQGGGNHFVYLVDSSGSMGDGFESARSELLASVDMLKPDQRFYVVFFDEKPDYMRLTNANQDEPRSVYATRQNKAALRRWAMRVSKDRGRNPKEPLLFSLKLRADVIFLLSDGEFPQLIEDLLKEENKVENLFGESRPISIVHTINYHSKEGESRMRRIAQQNGGQYRHVPKP